MLILAGVSINAIVGDNGILTQTQYASFLNEMSAVEEAVQLWKAGETIEANGEESKVIPANGLCKANELTEAERLVGEVGYYRVWSLSETQPTTNILSDASTFNSSFKAEITPYPAGVQDLYYLNNEALEIKGNKTYLIDAATGMIYSMTGISLKGVRCYSSNMAKAVMNGDSTMPLFAEANVSGTGSEEKLAGNISTEYLMDENGNYILDESENKIKNPDYNPYGFQIIADPYSNNVYKLYNNGELYGKGVKGRLLNTSQNEMEKINANIWQELKIPDNLKNYKEFIIGETKTIFIIDENNDLWGFGDNISNFMGLTDEQQVEYTGREWIKLNVNGEKVKKFFANNSSSFAITEQNKLYAAGNNNYGQLGLGHTNSALNCFSEVRFDKVSQITEIKTENGGSSRNKTIIMCDDNTFYFAGINNYDVIGNGNKSEQENTFVQIWDGNNGPDIDQDVREYILGEGNLVLLNDGTVWCCGYMGYYGRNLTSEKKGEFRRCNINDVTSIIQVNGSTALFVIKKDTYTDIWVTTGNGSTAVGTDNKESFKKLLLPDGIEEKIVEIGATEQNVFILLDDGSIYASGAYSSLGLDLVSGVTSNFEKISINSIKSLNVDKSLKRNNRKNNILIESMAGKIYTTANEAIMFQNDILQLSWSKIASNVLYFSGISNSQNSSCYVDRDNNLWVVGSNSDILGLGEQVEKESNIKNYTMVEDSNIKGKVVEAQVANNLIAVKLKDGSLWTSGYYKDQGYPGWAELENKNYFAKVLDNVTEWSIYDRIRTAISNGELYGWGTNFSGSTGVGSKASTVPLKATNLPTELSDISNIDKLQIDTWTRTHIVTKEGKLFLTGNNMNGAFDGGHTSTGYYSEYNHNLNFEIGEAVKDMKWSLVLTTKGNVFGFGNENKLGINKTTNNLVEMQKLPITGVEQLVRGNGFYIVVKTDGTVWGTGSNLYGVLGRWIGIDRSSPNSRYKTAFEWVECPELEI